jgi:type IV secretion system protein TrbE
LRSLASAPAEERTLTGLAVLIQSSALMAALTPYTLDGAYGRLLDGAAERIATSNMLHIEMEELMGHKALIAPVLTYLFHRLEARFDGRPTLLVLDEAWTFLDDAIFAARIREWLKTLRKKNVAVVFATQSLADIERSSIAPALIESCPTRIFLPNDRAREPQARSIYARFGLNDRQIEILSLAAPKRDYYAQTARGNRLFELGLGPVALAVCAAASPDDQRLIDRCLAEGEATGFAGRFLQAKGLGWAADLLTRWGPPAAPVQPLPALRASPVAALVAEDAGAALIEPETIREPATSQPDDAAAEPLTPAPVAPSKPALAPMPSRSASTPLPGLPGGPPLPERLSPFRIVAGQSKRRHP